MIFISRHALMSLLIKNVSMSNIYVFLYFSKFILMDFTPHIYATVPPCYKALHVFLLIYLITISIVTTIYSLVVEVYGKSWNSSNSFALTMIQWTLFKCKSLRILTPEFLWSIMSRSWMLNQGKWIFSLLLVILKLLSKAVVPTYVPTSSV